MEHENITTAFEIDGKRVTKNLGIVRGITVRSRSIVGNIGALFQVLLGGNITLYETLCEKAREQSYERMVAHAKEMGATGIIGMRYDATEIGGGITEVLAYGTAVVME